MPVSRTSAVAAARSRVRRTQSTSDLIRDAVVSPGGKVTCVMRDDLMPPVKRVPAFGVRCLPFGSNFAVDLRSAYMKVLHEASSTYCIVVRHDLTGAPRCGTLKACAARLCHGLSG